MSIDSTVSGTKYIPNILFRLNIEKKHLFIAMNKICDIDSININRLYREEKKEHSLNERIHLYGVNWWANGSKFDKVIDNDLLLDS